MRCIKLVLTVSLSAALGACGGRPAAESSAPVAGSTPSPRPETASSPVASPGTAGEYEIRGAITELAADRRSVTLDHEEIPGFMAAMKMQYRVAGPEVLTGLAPGDRVRGRLRVRGTDYVITSLERR